MTARVLVTESDSHLGFGLVQHLLDHGYDVQAGVRHGTDERNVVPLRLLGAKVIDLDLDRPDKLETAMKGVDGLFHTLPAQPSESRLDETERAVAPVEGVLNVLAAARNAEVRRVVFTCRPVSDAAIENRAREFTSANAMDMVTINPATVLGPGFRRHSACTETIERILRQQLPALPPLNTSYVDVRDVADLQRLAFEHDESAGSYTAAAAYAPIEEVARMIQAMEPSIRVPHHLLPQWMLRPASVLDAITHRVLGCRRRLSAALLDEMERPEFRDPSDRATRDFDWRPRPLGETLADTLAWIRQTFMTR
jgi:dihydroflavonol-4-reductase